MFQIKLYVPTYLYTNLLRKMKQTDFWKFFGITNTSMQFETGNFYFVLIMIQRTIETIYLNSTRIKPVNLIHRRIQTAYLDRTDLTRKPSVNGFDPSIWYDRIKSIDLTRPNKQTISIRLQTDCVDIGSKLILRNV